MNDTSKDKSAGGSATQHDRTGRVRETFMRRVQKRFFLRFHMSLILLATALSGVLFTKLMLMLEVENIVLRYPLAVLAAYLAFFFYMKLWLLYLSRSNSIKVLDGAGDVLSGIPDLSFGGGGSGGGSLSFSGGGGGSGGGGASGLFEGAGGNAQAVVAAPSSGGSGSSPGILDGVGDAVSGIFDDDSIVLVALGILLAVTVGSAIYLVYIAPHILSEAAFDFLLGTSLIKSYRRMNQPDWMGSVFRDTYKPFLVVLIIALVAAWVIHAHDPNITKISDAFR